MHSANNSESKPLTSDAQVACITDTQQIRAHYQKIDWALTPLGAMASWPESLQNITRICLAANTPMCIFAGQDLVLLYNEAFTQLLGASLHPWALGRPGRFVGERLWPWLHAEVTKVFQEAKSIQNDDKRILNRGDGRTVESRLAYSLTPIQEADGRVIGVFAIVHRNEEFRRVENALRQSEDKFRVLVEATSQAVWETNGVGEVVTDSPSWRAYTGQSLDDWLSNGWLNAVHPEERQYAKSQWREALDAQRKIDIELRLSACDGDYR